MSSPSVFLHVVDDDHTEHLLPYGHLLYVGYTPPLPPIAVSAPDIAKKQGSEIGMVFAAHTVVIQGDNLQETFKKIKAMTGDKLRASSNESKPSEARITSIVVAMRSDLDSPQVADSAPQSDTTG